ncbi:hypothetical protein DHEL01_v212183 [Diaporthe helianthi]|uniref:Ecp2 effector protein domain-containing protein n=1 Tax=Diaporthe helianthi TaxID=158607 RepID=A0A2P5HGP9_DIAHE|nr:hypothetical protein DHEL01_v212183 [Diaporthe helianthi]
MLQKTLTFTMAIAAMANFLLTIAFANAALTGDSPIPNGHVLSSRSLEGELVNMTTEITFPGPLGKVNVTGTAEQVIEYIKTEYSDYEWPKVEDSDANTSKVQAEDNTVYCSVGRQGSYPLATEAMSDLRQLGSYIFNVGGGPGTCVQVACKSDLDSGEHHLSTAIQFCNDDLLGASPSYNAVADLAQIVMDKCVEFGTPISWVRGQAFHATLPWNVIITAEDGC